MDVKNEDRNTRTIGKARPRVDAAIMFWEFTLMLARFELSLEMKEVRAFSSVTIVFERAKSMISA